MLFGTWHSAFALYTYLFNQVVVLNCKDLQHFLFGFLELFMFLYYARFQLQTSSPVCDNWPIIN